MTDPSDLPAWAREDAFSASGPGPWGWVDKKGRRQPCESFEALEQAIVRDAGARVDLVWTPHAPNLRLPEELPALHPALKAARLRWADWEIGEGKRQMQICGVLMLVLMAYHGFDWSVVFSSGTIGLALLLFLVLGFIPWYQGHKRMKKARSWVAGEMAEDAPEFRFETWLDHQKAPFTWGLLGLLLLVGGVQILWRGHPPGLDSVAKAGLTKSHGMATDWWRLFTAPFLHGHWIHFLMNASALAYVGKRTEVFARWPHLLSVFLFSAWVGGEASARFVTASSIGASGGIMGLLGFLIVFETMHRTLVPESARRRLFAGVILTGVIGILGFRFIDNFAHAGGLLAGMLYAALVFPRSASAHRPATTVTDLTIGGIAAALLLASALLACWKILT